MFFKSFCLKIWYVVIPPMDRLGYIANTMVRRIDYAKINFGVTLVSQNGKRMMLFLDHGVTLVS